MRFNLAEAQPCKSWAGLPGVSKSTLTILPALRRRPKRPVAVVPVGRQSILVRGDLASTEATSVYLGRPKLPLEGLVGTLGGPVLLSRIRMPSFQFGLNRRCRQPTQLQ